MGTLARAGDGAVPTSRGGPGAFKAALAAGMVIASFTVEDFGVRRLLEVQPEEFEARLQEYRELIRVEP